MRIGVAVVLGAEGIAEHALNTRPLDEQFLTLMSRYARNNDVVFVSPFWSLNLFAYVSWRLRSMPRPTRASDRYRPKRHSRT